MDTPEEYWRKSLLKKGFSESFADRQVLVFERNSAITTAFFACMAVGMAIGVVNTPIRFLQTFDAGTISEFIRNSDFIKYWSNHVKGGGQAIYMSQIANLALSQLMQEREEAKHRDEKGYHEVALAKDFSGSTGAACLAGGYAWEKLSQNAHKNNVFDDEDMLWYVIGVASLVVYNKGIKGFIDSQYPDLEKPIDAKPQPKPEMT